MTRQRTRRRKRRSKRQREFVNSLLFFLTTLLSISGLLTYLWVYNEINITSRDISALKLVRDNVAAENEEMHSKIANLNRVDRITDIARTKLHMVTPVPETLVVFVDPRIYQEATKKE